MTFRGPSFPTRGDAAGLSGWVCRNFAVIGVVMTAFGVYTGTLTHALVWDDPQLVRLVQDRVVQGGGMALLRSEFLLDVNVPLGYYRPVVLLSLWADSLFAPAFPYSYHLTNVLLHTVNSVLVLWFLRQVTGATWGPALGALVFAAHPVHAESVAFVSGRTDLFAAAFVLICAVAWARDRAGVATRPWLERACGIGAFVLGALSKEVAFMLPPVLLAWDLLEKRDPSGGLPGWWKRNATWVLGWTAALALVFLLRWFVAGLGLKAQIAQNAPDISPPAVLELSRVPAMLATYLRLLVVPWPLNAYYMLSAVRLTWITIGGAMVLLGLCACTAAEAHRRAGLRGLAWILGFLLPVSGVVPLYGSVLAERFLYLPSVGMALIACCALERPLKSLSLRRSLRAAVLVLTVIFGAAAVARAGVWRDEMTLFRNMVDTSPTFAGGHHNLGTAYLSLGRYEEAAQSFRRALAIKGDYSDAYNNLGTVYFYMGRGGEAITFFRHALRIRPTFAEAYNNMGNVLVTLGRSEEAMESFGRALRIRPNFAEAYNNRGNTLLMLGRREEAMESFRQAVRVRPDYGDAYVSIGNAFRFSGDIRNAAENYRHAIAVQPGNGTAHFNLALAYLALGEKSAAAAEYKVLARLDAALARQLLPDIEAARSLPSGR